MTISMYSASVPVFKQILGSLSDLLDKAETHAVAKKIDPNALLQARLFPDMFPLTRQIMIAADFAKGACARLAGMEVPKYEDTEQSFAELRARIAKTVAFIDSLPRDQIDGSEERDITTSAGPNSKSFKGQTYLLQYALPQFFFHATTAYAILRHNGIEIGKKNFMGQY
ncbi:MAG: hypothetical protein A3I66_21410 [Burkholderiales bacterium RIFCSPLOWO2_02_FULL_57_36]|nr:MAG: hypothetical protein A3I66_21410 [Burkholderiales bacterium RIFCSPLOWO2_02_FULL_57_36]